MEKTFTYNVQGKCYRWYYIRPIMGIIGHLL